MAFLTLKLPGGKEICASHDAKGKAVRLYEGGSTGGKVIRRFSDDTPAADLKDSLERVILDYHLKDIESDEALHGFVIEVADKVRERSE